ncbi:proclotting enzyme [Lepeophtheirus salmonis]|uniref:proclotting enzyme n=1 Tax=Lepeophtheirus salmonis TaxID=72036 RepID=UPI003AF39423
MVALLKSRNLEHHCGGTFISNQYILTAAHCVERYDPSELIARLAEFNLSLRNETPSFDVQITEIIIHERYQDYTYQNDIAIIKLIRLVKYSETINHICLPPRNKFFTGQEALAIGWGQQYFGGPFSDVLLQVKVNVWAQEPCTRNYARKNRNITREMLCAGNGGRDSCGGDSGGPLNCLNEKGVWELCGVISFGFRCALTEYPGVYVRVTQYIDWISQKIY